MVLMSVNRAIKGLLSICAVLLITVGAGTAADSTRLPLDSIPKLSESFELGDYKMIAQSGTLFPDKIGWDSVWLKTGMRDDKLVPHMPDSLTHEKGVYRTRDQQFQFIRELLYKNNFSMHYYILADIYYHRQLFGWFKTYVWPIAGVGRALFHLQAGSETGTYTVWLIELQLEPISADSVVFTQGDTLAVTREGNPRVEWNIDRNAVAIFKN